VQRVLLISDVTAPGGVGTHMVQLATVAEREEWTVQVVLDDARGNAEMVSLMRQSGITVRTEPLYHGRNSADVVERVTMNTIEEFAPDIVHVHCGSLRGSLFCREAIVRSGMPLIFTDHYVANDVLYDDRTMERLRWLHGAALHVVSICDEGKRLLREHFKICYDNQVVVPYGVRLSKRITVPTVTTEYPLRTPPPISLYCDW